MEFNDGFLRKYWLLPEMSFNVARAETYDTAGRLFELRESTCEIANGLPYPKTAVERTYYYTEPDDEDSRRLLHEERLEVESIITRSDEIPESLFHVEIPPSADIFDQDTQTLISDPVQVQAYLDEIATWYYSKRFWRWILPIFGLVVFLGLGAWWRFRRTRKPVLGS